MTLIRSGSRVPGNQPDEVRVPNSVSEADPLQVQAAEMFAEQMTTGAVPTIRAIRTALRVGQPRAQQLQKYLAAIARTSDVAAPSGVQ